MSEKINKNKVISFRVPESASKDCSDRLVDKPVWGVKSVNQFARKLFLDFAAGRLSYANEEHYGMDAEMISEKEAESATAGA